MKDPLGNNLSGTVAPPVSGDLERSVRSDGIAALFDRLAELDDRKAAWKAMGDAGLVQSLAGLLPMEKRLRASFNEHPRPAAVWRGLAMLFPLSAEWLLVLDPAAHDEIKAPIEDFARAIEEALATQNELLRRLSHFCRADLQGMPERKAELSALRKELSRLDIEKATGLRELARLERDKIAAENLLADVSRSIRDLRKQQGRLAAKLENLTRQAEESEAERAEVHKQKDALERKIRQQQERYRQSVEQLESARKDLDALQSALEAYKSMGQVGKFLTEIRKIRARVEKFRLPDRLDDLGGD